MVGMVLGGLAGAPLGPLGAAGGGIGGYTLGRQAFRAGEAYFYPHRGPQGPLETAGEIAKDIGTGALIEAVGPLAGRVARGAGSLFRRTSGSEPPSLARDAVLEAAKRQEIPLTVSAESGSATAGALERFSERMLLGGQAVPKAREATRRGAERAVERVAESVGGGLPSEVGGAAVQEDLARRVSGRREYVDHLIGSFSDELGGQRGVTPVNVGRTVSTGLREVNRAARSTASELYAQARAAAPPDATVPLEITGGVAGRLLEMEQRLRGVARAPVQRAAAGLAAAADPGLAIAGRLGEGVPPAVVESIIEQYGLARTGVRPLDEAVAMLQRLKGMMRHQPDDATRRGLRELSDAVGADINRYAATQGGEFAARQQLANDFYRREVAEDFARGGALRKMLTGRPGAVATQVLGMRNADAIGRVMDRLPPDIGAQVRRSAFETLLQRATKAGEVGPAALDQQLSRLHPDVRARLFAQYEPQLTALQGELRELGRTGADLTEGTILRMSPDQIVRGLTRGTAGNVGDLPRIWPTLAEDTRRKMRGSLVQSTIDAATKDGQFSLARFLTEKRKVPEGVWSTVLGQHPDQALREITRVLERIDRFDRVSLNPSGTGHALLQGWEILRMMSMAGTAMVGGLSLPTLAGEVAMVTAPSAVGKFMTSPLARRLFTEQGIRSIPDRQGPAAILLRTLLAPIGTPGDEGETPRRSPGRQVEPPPLP